MKMKKNVIEHFKFSFHERMNGFWFYKLVSHTIINIRREEKLYFHAFLFSRKSIVPQINFAFSWKTIAFLYEKLYVNLQKH